MKKNIRGKNVKKSILFMINYWNSDFNSILVEYQRNNINKSNKKKRKINMLHNNLLNVGWRVLYRFRLEPGEGFLLLLSSWPFVLISSIDAFEIGDKLFMEVVASFCDKISSLSQRPLNRNFVFGIKKLLELLIFGTSAHFLKLEKKIFYDFKWIIK